MILIITYQWSLFVLILCLCHNLGVHNFKNEMCITRHRTRICRGKYLYEFRTQVFTGNKYKIWHDDDEKGKIRWNKQWSGRNVRDETRKKEEYFNCYLFRSSCFSFFFFLYVWKWLLTSAADDQMCLFI